MGDEPASDEVTRIRELLRANPRGMNIKEIAEAVAMSRNSVAKYLDVLTASGHLDVRQMGNAKLYHLSRRVPLDTVMNLAREMIIVLDRNLQLVQANDSFLDFTGSSREAITGSRLSALPIPLLSSREESALSDLIRGGPDWKKEIRALKDGNEVFFSARFIPTFFEDGDPGIAVILENVTDRTLGRSASREGDRLLHSLFQIPSVPKFMINRNHKVVYWDRALEILTKIRSEEVLGTSRHWRAFYPEERPCLLDLIVDGKFDELDQYYHGDCKKEVSPDTEYACTGFFPDMQPGGRWLRITASVIRDSQGNLVGAMETIEDITDKKNRDFVVIPGE